MQLHLTGLRSVKWKYKHFLQPLKTSRGRDLLSLTYSDFRRTELSRLNFSDLLFDEQYVIVRSGKFNVRREIPLPPCVINILRVYFERERVVLCRVYDPDAKLVFLLNR